MIRALIVIVALTGIASAEKKAAERYFRAGETAYRAQKFLVAAQNFEQAYLQLPAPEIAFSAAQAYRKQFHVDSDIEHVKKSVHYYQLYLAQVKTGGRVSDAAESLEDMQRELDRRGVAMKPDATEKPRETVLGISVVFADKQTSSLIHAMDDKESAPQIAIKAFLDGGEVEPDALNPVKPGDHVVGAEAEGYARAERKVHVIAGAPENIQLELQPLPAQISIVTEPGARIGLDGRIVAVTPTGPLAMTAGKHLITVLHSGREAIGMEITTMRAERRSIPLPLEKSTKRRVFPYVLAVAGGLVAFTGLTGLVAWRYDGDAHDKLDQLRKVGDKDPSVLDDYNSSRVMRDRLETGMWITAGGALVVGAMAAGLYYFDNPSAEGARLVPVASANTAGAMIFGQF